METYGDIFRKELIKLINKYGQEEASATPDYVLANYIIGCLEVFAHTITDRTEWYVEKMELEEPEDV